MGSESGDGLKKAGSAALEGAKTLGTLGVYPAFIGDSDDDSEE